MKLLFIAAFLSLSYAAPSEKPPENFNITILHTNDIHSHFLQSDKRGGNCTEVKAGNKSCFGGVARILTKVREIKANNKNTLFFNAGDFYQGTVWYSVLKYNIVSLAMENMMYDAVCLGNHEFDDGPEGLYPFLVRMEAANVTVLGTNLETEHEPALNNITVVKSKIYTFNGVQMGVMGVVTTETLTIAKPGNIKILDEIESVEKEIQELKKQDVKIFALISHVGYNKDQEIAKNVKDLHFIVGGHTNTFLYSGNSIGKDKPGGLYPTIVNRTSGSFALVTQDFWFGKYLGYLNLEFYGNGTLKAWSGNPILLDHTIQEDDSMLQILQPYKEEVQRAGEEYIGISKVLLEADNKICRLKECNMVNLIADSFFAYYADWNNTQEGAWSNVNAAVVNAGITRTSIKRENLATDLGLTEGKTSRTFSTRLLKGWMMLKNRRNKTSPAVYSTAVCPRTSTERCSVLFVNQAYESEGPLEAVALSFCLAWVFDLQYFVKYCRTFVCFERLVGLKHSKLGCMGTRRLTSLN